MCGCGSAAKDGTLVGPACSWCPTNPTLIPPHPDRPALFPNGETCGELFDYFAEWYTKEACIDAASTIHLVAARCECPGVELPVWYESIYVVCFCLGAVALLPISLTLLGSLSGYLSPIQSRATTSSLVYTRIIGQDPIINVIILRMCLLLQ
jgi:hypothetical protein